MLNSYVYVCWAFEASCSIEKDLIGSWFGLEFKVSWQIYFDEFQSFLLLLLLLLLLLFNIGILSMF